MRTLRWASASPSRLPSAEPSGQGHPCAHRKPHAEFPTPSPPLHPECTSRSPGTPSWAAPSLCPLSCFLQGAEEPGRAHVCSNLLAFAPPSSGCTAGPTANPCASARGCTGSRVPAEQTGPRGKALQPPPANPRPEPLPYSYNREQKTCSCWCFWKCTEQVDVLSWQHSPEPAQAPGKHRSLLGSCSKTGTKEPEIGVHPYL